MRVYVAGKWEDKERVRDIMTWLRGAGHVITHDWTAEPDNTHSTQIAIADKQGVMTAEALVLVVEKPFIFKGAYVEFGIAVARGIPIHIIGAQANSCVFVALPEVCYGLDGLA